MSAPYYTKSVALAAPERAYLARLAESPARQASVQSALKAFLFFRAWLGRADKRPTPLTALSNDVLVEFRNWMTRRGYAEMSRDNYVSHITNYLRYLQDQEELGAAFSIERAVSRSKETRKRHSYPLKEIPAEIAQVVKYFDLASEASDAADAQLTRLEDLRNRAVVLTLYASAGRVSEIVNLKRKDVQDGRRDTIKIIGKGSKPRYIYLTPEAQAAIVDYTAARDDLSEWLFVNHRRKVGTRLTRQSVWNVINRACDALRIPHVSPHMLRHLRARQLLTRGAPLKAIQQILGHEDIGTTGKVYARYSPEQTKELFDKFTQDVSEL